MKEHKSINPNRDRIFNSHISSLPGAVQSSNQTQDQIQAAQTAREQKRYSDPAFQRKMAGLSGAQQGGRTTVVVQVDLAPKPVNGFRPLSPDIQRNTANGRQKHYYSSIQLC